MTELANWAIMLRANNQQNENYKVNRITKSRTNDYDDYVIISRFSTNAMNFCNEIFTGFFSFYSVSA